MKALLVGISLFLAFGAVNSWGQNDPHLTCEPGYVLREHSFDNWKCDLAEPHVIYGRITHNVPVECMDGYKVQGNGCVKNKPLPKNSSSGAEYRILNKSPRVLGNDSRITPGVIRSKSLEEACSVRTGTVQHVTEAMKRKVFASYGIDLKNRRDYEIDYLLPLEILGANDIRNLWPQPYAYPGAHQKDILENKLHKMICSKELTPEQAQRLITTDWFAAYKTYVKPRDGRLGR